MAYTFEVFEMRDSRPMGLIGTPTSISIDWELKHQVKVTGTGGDDPKDVDTFSVITATGLPVVNLSVYYSTTSGLVNPFLVCREKRIAKVPNTADRWEVTSRFKSIDGNPVESGNVPIAPPAAITDFTPRVQRFFKGTEKVLYEDYAASPIPATLPSGELFSEPLISKVPILGLKITQYEASTTTDDNFMDRLYRFNNATYRSKSAYSWIVDDIEPSDVLVQLSGGSQAAKLVTYTLLHNPLTDGWRSSLALLDYQIKVGGKFVPNREGDPETAKLAKIDSTGAKKANQSDPPDYKVFIQQQSAAFPTSSGGFLQV